MRIKIEYEMLCVGNARNEKYSYESFQEVCEKLQWKCDRFADTIVATVTKIFDDKQAAIKGKEQLLRRMRSACSTGMGIKPCTITRL